jgi:hypothetical protein
MPSFLRNIDFIELKKFLVVSTLNRPDVCAGNRDLFEHGK